MPTQLESAFTKLIQSVSKLPGVQSVGRSGGRPLPENPSDGDIDVFIYCTAVPPESGRRSVLDTICSELDDIAVGVFGGGHWGVGDLVHIGGIEIWLMYMTTEEADAEVAAVLHGDFPDRVGSYYPTGRCAMYLGMSILCDKSGFLQGMKDRLGVYPESLSRKLADYHLNALKDTEDLERAVTREDVLFFHFALETALDHFLQALFAMNRVFFPSRKRSLDYIRGFKVKPELCEQRLLEVLRLSGISGEIKNSYEIWGGLVRDLRLLD